MLTGGEYSGGYGVMDWKVQQRPGDYTRMFANGYQVMVNVGGLIRARLEQVEALGRPGIPGPTVRILGRRYIPHPYRSPSGSPVEQPE